MSNSYGGGGGWGQGYSAPPVREQRHGGPAYMGQGQRQGQGQGQQYQQHYPQQSHHSHQPQHHQHNYQNSYTARVPPPPVPAMRHSKLAAPSRPIVPAVPSLLGKPTHLATPKIPAEPATLLKKTVRYLVAAQMSKYLSSRKHFDNNIDEFRRSCEHLIDRIMQTEKKKPENYKSRRMQTGVLSTVNSYMAKYGTSKEQKVNDRKRKRYDVDLLTPFLPEEEAGPTTPNKRARTSGAENDVTPRTSTDAGTTAALPNATPPSSQKPLPPIDISMPYTSQNSMTRRGTIVDNGFTQQDEIGDTPDASATQEPSQEPTQNSIDVDADADEQLF